MSDVQSTFAATCYQSAPSVTSYISEGTARLPTAVPLTAGRNTFVRVLDQNNTSHLQNLDMKTLVPGPGPLKMTSLPQPQAPSPQPIRPQPTQKPRKVRRKPPPLSLVPRDAPAIVTETRWNGPPSLPPTPATPIRLTPTAPNGADTPSVVLYPDESATSLSPTWAQRPP